MINFFLNYQDYDLKSVHFLKNQLISNLVISVNNLHFTSKPNIHKSNP